jgi:hypothetical protein
MWISSKKHKEILREERQDHRINDVQDEVWRLSDEIRELKDRIKDLEKK